MCNVLLSYKNAVYYQKHNLISICVTTIFPCKLSIIKKGKQYCHKLNVIWSLTRKKLVTQHKSIMIRKHWDVIIRNFCVSKQDAKHVRHRTFKFCRAVNNYSHIHVMIITFRFAWWNVKLLTLKRAMNLLRWWCQYEIEC